MLKMKTRAALKDLQASATDKGVLVGSPAKMTVRVPQFSEKFFKTSKEPTKVPNMVEKENNKTNKLFKRKNAKNEKVTSKMSKLDTKKSSVKVKKDVKPSQSKKNLAITAVKPTLSMQNLAPTASSEMCLRVTGATPPLSRPNMASASHWSDESLIVKEGVTSTPSRPDVVPASNFSGKSLKVEKDATSTWTKLKVPPTTSCSKTNSLQFSGMGDIKMSTKCGIGNVTVDQNVSDIIPLVTSDSVSHTYWQDVSEQRLVALEKVLLENEQLHDEISVLQTENAMLKDALDAAENLLKMEGLLD